jgi:Uma2 family endonuclease
LLRALNEFVESQSFGELFYAPMEVVLSDHDVFQPDISFISNNRLHIIGDRNIQGSPDLVIEILSPSTETRDRDIKLEQYLRFGVRGYWLIDPQERTLEVLKAGGHRVRDRAGLSREDNGHVTHPRRHPSGG